MIDEANMFLARDLAMIAMETRTLDETSNAIQTTLNCLQVIIKIELTEDEKMNEAMEQLAAATAKLMNISPEEWSDMFFVRVSPIEWWWVLICVLEEYSEDVMSDIRLHNQK